MGKVGDMGDQADFVPVIRCQEIRGAAILECRTIMLWNWPCRDFELAACSS